MAVIIGLQNKMDSLNHELAVKIKKLKKGSENEMKKMKKSFGLLKYVLPKILKTYYLSA